MRFNVYASIVTPESAEHGDCDRLATIASNVTLREALTSSGFGIGGWEDCGRWLTTADSETDYVTGEDTQYSIHPARDVTPASYARLARLLTTGSAFLQRWSCDAVTDNGRKYLSVVASTRTAAHRIANARLAADGHRVVSLSITFGD